MGGEERLRHWWVTTAVAEDGAGSISWSSCAHCFTDRAVYEPSGRTVFRAAGEDEWVLTPPPCRAAEAAP